MRESHMLDAHNKLKLIHNLNVFILYYIVFFKILFKYKGIYRVGQCDEPLVVLFAFNFL